jgi:predicted nuclease of restriction endonuclease-like (RecB) superfamily
MNKEYIDFIAGLKQNIVQSRYVATRLVIKEQLKLYFRIGKMLHEKIQAEKWGAKIVKQIADDLQKAVPGLRGFSQRSLMNMRKFFIEYQHDIFMQLPTAQIKLLGNTLKTTKGIREEFWKISFTHHTLILNKCSTNEERFFYIEQAASLFWSVTLLEHHIEADLYTHQGKLPNNFASTLPENIKPSALQVFQDEYLMDFITPAVIEDERVLESKVVSEIKNFILWMGKGFCFIGNQYRLEIDDEEFFIDLLFFNRHLQCLVAFELKRGKFKPAYAGQLNFYLNVLDEKVKLSHENPSIGIILCKEKNNTIVEFAVKTIDKAMGVATYRTTKEVPNEMKGILPDADDLAKLLG